MIGLILDATGKEALEAVQTAFPDTWKKEIAYAQHRIRIIKNSFGIDTVAAVDKFTDYEKDNAKRLLVRAAGYMIYLQEGISFDMECAAAELDFVQVQLRKIESSPLSAPNRLSAAYYYQGKSFRHQTKIAALKQAAPELPAVPITYKSLVFGVRL